jgi:hypothetical protein
MITGTHHSSFSEKKIKRLCLHSRDGRNIEFGCDKVEADSHWFPSVVAQVLS